MGKSMTYRPDGSNELQSWVACEVSNTSMEEVSLAISYTINHQLSV